MADRTPVADLPWCGLTLRAMPCRARYVVDLAEERISASACHNTGMDTRMDEGATGVGGDL